jgi:hypothetical protein
MGVLVYSVFETFHRCQYSPLALWKKRGNQTQRQASSTLMEESWQLAKSLASFASLHQAPNNSLAAIGFVSRNHHA